MNIVCVCQSKTLQGPVGPAGALVLVQFNAVNGQGFYTFYMTPAEAEKYVLGTNYPLTLGAAIGG